jgi:hypothetical protein
MSATTQQQLNGLNGHTKSSPDQQQPQQQQQHAVDNWQPDSWRHRSIRQQPDYKNAQALSVALETIRTLPPLVHHTEVDELRKQLGQVARGMYICLYVFIRVDDLIITGQINTL